MSESRIDQLLEHLNVEVEGFAVCEVGDHCGLSLPAWDKIVIHIVLSGEGSIETEHGILPLQEGAIAVAPKNLAKRLNGRGPVTNLQRLDKTCPFAPGVVKVRARSGDGEVLTVACALVSAGVGGGPNFFDQLQQPLVEQVRDQAQPYLVQAMLAETKRPGVGTKAILGALMKQCLILLLRKHLQCVRNASPYLPLMNPKLTPAVQTMLTHPEEPHCLNSLAKLSGMSRASFARAFQQSYAVAPMEYLHSVRLQKAARLLRSSSLPVKAIAGAVGFASRSYFSRAFRVMFGVDPSAFREAEGSNQKSD